MLICAAASATDAAMLMPRCRLMLMRDYKMTRRRIDAAAMPLRYYADVTLLHDYATMPPPSFILVRATLCLIMPRHMMFSAIILML